MLMFDRYALDDAAKVTFTKDGYLTATPRVARTGIQLYYGRELGVQDKDANKVFKVYRPAEEVFSADSMSSFAYKPVTDDHPPEDVTAKNWSKYSKGQMSGDVARDGQFIRVPMALMDGSTIQKFKDGKAELSVGYSCEIEWSAGQTADGQSYDARQKSIRVNHLAVVDAARGGKDLRIGDGSGASVDLAVYAQALEAVIAGNVNRDDALAHASGHLARDSKGASTYPIIKDGRVYLTSLRASTTDAATRGDGDVLAALNNLIARSENSTAVSDGNTEKETMTKVIMVDGISVEVASEQSAQIVQRALDNAGVTVKTLQSKVSDTETALATVQKQLSDATAKHATEVATRDAEITTLKKQVEDTKVTPALLDQMVKERSEIAGKGKTLLGDKLVVDGKSVIEIMRQVVDAKLGDAAKGWNDDQIKISFDTLTANVKVSGLADTAAAFAGGTALTNSEQLISARDKRLENAWKGTAANA